MEIENSLRLLARNSRKRLLIGVGVELLVKAIYLKQGYAINRPAKGHKLAFPFLAEEATGVRLDEGESYMLGQLVHKLRNILPLREKKTVVHGLSIVKVFRNKEGHTVTDSHRFDPTNYRDIASALVSLYLDAFGQTLSVSFSVAPYQRAVWKLSPPDHPPSAQPASRYMQLMPAARRLERWRCRACALECGRC